jgi:acyl-CoA dehydrogenase
MDFALPPETEALRRRIADFVAGEIMPLEANRANYDEHENIALPVLEALRAKVKAARLWAPQMPRELGGLGLNVSAMAACYEAMGRSIFGPVAFNCAAPDDGNMILLARVGTAEQRQRWLMPIVEGRVRSAFAMTEPMPGGGSDPAAIRTRAVKKGERWLIEGHKWFITGADAAQHFILIARTSDDPRKGLTAFLFDRDQPGWKILRRIPIMGPEEHGGHCELLFEGLEIPDENRLLDVGGGLKVTQIRLGTARLTLHALARRRPSARWKLRPPCRRTANFGMTLAKHEGCNGSWAGGHGHRARPAADAKAAWKLDQGDFARKEVSMAKVQVSEALNKAVDTAIQLCGARGYSKDTPLEWMYRYARQARLVDGASEVHKMVLAGAFLAEGTDFWS